LWRAFTIALDATDVPLLAILALFLNQGFELHLYDAKYFAVTDPLSNHSQKVGMRLPVGSLALRPDALPIGNLRPLVTKTPLP